MTRVRFPTIVRLRLRACGATPASESTVATSASSVCHCCGVVDLLLLTRGPQIPIHFVDSVLVSNRLCWIRFCGFESQDSHFSSRPAIRIHFVHSVLLSNRLFGIRVLDSIRWIRIRVRISCVNSDDISRRPLAAVCLGTIRPHVDVYRLTHLMLLMSHRRF